MIQVRNLRIESNAMLTEIEAYNNEPRLLAMFVIKERKDPTDAIPENVEDAYRASGLLRLKLVRVVA